MKKKTEIIKILFFSSSAQHSLNTTQNNSIIQMYIFIYTYVCVHIYIYVFIHTSHAYAEACERDLCIKY